MPPNKYSHEYWMLKALRASRRAFALDEVPVGAIIVKDNKIIGRGYNTRETKQNPLHHAEIIAINQAARKLKSWRLLDCTLYVTLEPCTMCSGAIVLSRIPTVVFGAWDPKAGACGSIANVLADKKLNHQPTVISNICQAECSRILKEFFRKIRNS